jgi:ribosomal protein S18 acetylase RimI-like enzyme
VSYTVGLRSETSNEKDMYLISEIQPTAVMPPPRNLWSVAGGLTVSELAMEHTSEALAFLSERPLHTFAMAGFIRDNGLESPQNRGSFYAFRGQGGRLEGIALIGHAVLFETRTDAAIKAIAGLARRYPKAYIVLGEEMKVERFNYYYSRCCGTSQVTSREILFELKWPLETHIGMPGLRLATLEDLREVVLAHAQFAVEDRGINPLQGQVFGFVRRCARRIKRRRTWIWSEDGKLRFKADAVTQTPDVAYLEGIWTHPDFRGKGYGLRCLSQLTRALLSESRSVCLIVSADRTTAQSFYLKAGFKPIGHYESIYL